MAGKRKYKDHKLNEVVQIRVTPQQREWANSAPPGFVSSYLRAVIDTMMAQPNNQPTPTTGDENGR